MMLIQKPPQLLAFTAPAIHSHRRQASAPIAVVQPTRTPGLLSLSKPQQQRQSSGHRLPPVQRPQQHSKYAHPPKKAHQVVRAQISDPEVAITPTPQLRGRAHARQPKQSPRSASQSPVRGKHGRQPSPPLPQPEFGPTSQAEANCIIRSNHFDPFLDNAPPSPTLSPSPSGKLARRRQHNNSTPSKVQPVPVPAVRQPAPVNMASSEPLPGAFQSGLATPPVTPTRPSHASAMMPPDFAHLFGPVPRQPPSPSSKATRKHFRTPSEGVFYFSSDEELSTGPIFPPMKTSFSAPPVTPGPPVASVAPRAGSVSPSLEPGFFAGSLFQSSPSPDELPDI